MNPKKGRSPLAGRSQRPSKWRRLEKIGNSLVTIDETHFRGDCGLVHAGGLVSSPLTAMEVPGAPTTQMPRRE